MKSLLLLTAILFSLNSTAQLQTFAGSAGFLMNSSFLGPNYTVSNIVYTGHPHAVGSFNSDSTNLGLSKGIVMTTGLVFGNGSPVGPNDLALASYSNGTVGSPFVQNSIDAATLEFDISSAVDTIEFRYVLGSDEYPEYIGSQYSDEFLILLSGPGISQYDTLNKLPNGDLVGLNTINAAVNASYFIYNGNGNEAPYNQSDYYIQYDGFTIPLTAKASVTPFQTYHVTIVITDVADPTGDTGVFLEQCETCDYNAGILSSPISKIKCYPNPSSGNFSVEFPELSSKAELRIINYLGEEVRRFHVESGANKIAINDLPSGSFILELISESDVWRGKVIVN